MFSRLLDRLLEASKAVGLDTNPQDLLVKHAGTVGVSNLKFFPMLGKKYAKFWLTLKGKIVPVQDEHDLTAVAAHTNSLDLLEEGAIRGSLVSGGELSIEVFRTPNSKQISVLKSMASRYSVKELVYDRTDSNTQKLINFSSKIKSLDHLDYMLQYGTLDEARLMDLQRKQRTISWLYPTFSDRVKNVQGMGGIRLKSVDDDNWDFKVHSGTKKHVWYDCVLHFVGIRKTLEKYVRDRRLWVKDKSRVDLRRLAEKFIAQVNVQTFCSCPNDLYGGFHHIRGLPRYDAKYTNPELRPPKVRNPRQYGAFCKHTAAVMKALPFYTQTVAKWLNNFYAKDIKEIEAAAIKEFGWARKAAAELKKRVEPEIEKAPKTSGLRVGKTNLGREGIKGEEVREPEFGEEQ